MVNSIARNIPDNFIRNGNFATGTLEFWNPPENFVSYIIQPDPLNPGTYELYGLGHSGYILIEHQDFIPVKEGEIANITFEDTVPNGQLSYITLLCYDANYNLLQYMFTDEYPADGLPNQHVKRMRIPPSTAFIRLRYNAATGSGGYVTLKGVSLRLEDNTEAINGIIGTDIQVLEDLEAISAGGYKELPFKPADPDIAYRVIGVRMSCNAPTGASSGTHYMTLIVRNKTGSGINLLHGRYAYNKNITFDNSMWTTEISSAYPSDQGTIRDVISSIIVTSDTPLYIGYSNNTNVVQPNIRQTRIFYEVIRRNSAVNFG